MKPRCASSKSARSAKGRDRRTSAFAWRVAGSASLACADADGADSRQAVPANNTAKLAAREIQVAMPPPLSECRQYRSRPQRVDNVVTFALALILEHDSARLFDTSNAFCIGRGYSIADPCVLAKR